MIRLDSTCVVDGMMQESLYCTLLASMYEYISNKGGGGYNIGLFESLHAMSRYSIKKENVHYRKFSTCFLSCYFQCDKVDQVWG